MRPRVGRPRSRRPPCQAHSDPGDCQAALETATGELQVDLERYTVEVGAIDCENGQCTTWVSAVPTSDDDCIPLWEVEVTRPLIGSWSISMMTHGDPPCAFEP